MALNFRNSLSLFKHLPKSNFNRLPVAVVPNRNYFLNSFRISNSNVLQNGLCNHLSSSPTSINVPQREFHLLKRLTPEVVDTLFANKNEIVSKDTQRSLVQYGIRGRRKTVKAVLSRFYRLNWGIWIHPRTGRHNKLWKKSLERRKRSRTHVFCNATQTFMLDKMVSRYWKKKKFYVDDPYENYQTRPEFWITHRR